MRAQRTLARRQDARRPIALKIFPPYAAPIIVSVSTAFLRKCSLEFPYGFACLHVVTTNQRSVEAPVVIVVQDGHWVPVCFRKVAIGMLRIFCDEC